MAKKWRDLVAPMRADPLYSVRVEPIKRAMDDIMVLAKMRDEHGMSQRQVAGALGLSQANVFQIEQDRDLYLSTLASYIASLGGRLEIRAVFPDQVIDVVLQPEPEAITAED